jgi:hypothetical protein
LLEAWIDQGLPWQKGFTFQAGTFRAPLKPRAPVLPPARAGRDHPIDRILDVYYASHRLTPPAPIDDVALLRRLYLDLVGLLPAPGEREAFLKDAAPDKRVRLIRRLLGEKRPYTEHWLSFWNDLLRNDYAGTGYIDGGRQQITSWLYQSLLDNKPYDQFVRELINPVPGSAGFIKGIQWRGRVNASQGVELQFAQNVAQVFFGANLKCASCHDSFIDHWKLDHAYGLAAVVADRPLEIYRCDKPTGKRAQPRFLFPELGSLDGAQPKDKRLEQLARLVTHPDNGRFTRTIVNRLWQRLMGRGLVHPVDVMANQPWSEDLLDHLAVYLANRGFDLKELIEYIVTSRAYQAQATSKEAPGDDYVFRGPGFKRMTAEQFLDTVWMLTQAGPTQPAPSVPLPAFPEMVPAERRLVRACLVNADELMRALGRPNREQVVTTRPDQFTTLEALNLSNGSVLAEILERGAAHRLQGQPRSTGEQMVERLYLDSLCRRPTAGERGVALELLGTPPTPAGLADVLWAIIMLPEYQLIR